MGTFPYLPVGALVIFCRTMGLPVKGAFGAALRVPLDGQASVRLFLTRPDGILFLLLCFIHTCCLARERSYDMARTYQHLSFEERLVLENSLKEKKSLSQIAAFLGRSPSSLQREILRNRVRQQPQKLHSRADDHDCVKRLSCSKSRLCPSCNSTWDRCSYCERCNDVCPEFVKATCDRRDRLPACCNACNRYNRCHLHKYYYRARKAQDAYERRRSASRTGFGLNEEDIQSLAQIMTQGFKRGLSVYAIYAAHRDVMPCSIRTIYSLIQQGDFGSCWTDMPLKVRRRLRKKPSEHKVNRACRIGRSYQEYLAFRETFLGLEAVQLDTVHGKLGQHKVFMTLYWTKPDFLLVFLLEHNTSKEVARIFAHLRTSLGKEAFQKLFPAILTDGGSEFSDPDKIEGPPGEKWTRLFYCEPLQPGQKGALEQEHSLLRRIVPKGTNFDHLQQQDATLIASHITSYPRKPLNGKTPQEAFAFLFGVHPCDLFGLHSIDPKQVLLKPSLVPLCGESPQNLK